MKRRNFFRNGLLGISGLLFGGKKLIERSKPINKNDSTFKVVRKCDRVLLVRKSKRMLWKPYKPCTWNPRGEFDVSKTMAERIY